VPLPPVDSVDVVVKTPEPDKGRERVRRPGDRGHEHQHRSRHRDQRRPAEELEKNDSESANSVDSAAAPVNDDEDTSSREPRAYGPDADPRRDDQEHHIDYRA